jgi:DNA (cytosine-5)-methyltransferase 1
MRHLDLFSGIGGFALAARWSGFETVAFCEIDSYCQKVLNKHWPDVPIYGDIRELGKERLENDGISTGVDFLTGGFPCQPFSVAGRQKGQDDNRHLWPEMLRIISEIRPNWVIGENVSGFVSLALDDCLFDLESQGYETETFVLPACAVDAPHRRDRVWIMANTGRQLRSGSEFSRANGLENKEQNADLAQRSSAPPRKNVADPDSSGFKKQRLRISAEKKHQASECRSFWATEPSVGRVVDGLPHRVDRLKGLGNAVVPQLVHNLFEIIKQVDKEKGN